MGIEEGRGWSEQRESMLIEESAREKRESELIYVLMRLILHN